MAIFALVFTFYLYVKVSATFSNSSPITVLRVPVIVLFFAGLFCCSFLDCCDFLFWDAWDECFGLLIRPGFMYCTCWIPADIEYRITFLCHLECSCILLHGMPSTHCSTLPHGMCYPTQCFRVSKTLHLLQHLIISTAICICGGLNFLPERIWISCWRIEYLHCGKPACESSGFSLQAPS